MIRTNQEYIASPAQKTAETSQVEQAIRFAKIELGEAHGYLSSRPQFQKTCEIYCRIAAATAKQGTGLAVTLDTFDRATKVFVAYCKAWVLYGQGATREEVRSAIPVTGVREWLRRDSIPLALVKADPQYRVEKIERATSPKGFPLHSLTYLDVLPPIRTKPRSAIE